MISQIDNTFMCTNCGTLLSPINRKFVCACKMTSIHHNGSWYSTGKGILFNNICFCKKGLK